MDIAALKKGMETLKSDLSGGLIGSDIWVKGTGQPIVDYNGNLKAVALFDQIILNIEKSLEISEFPKMTDYFMTRLEGNKYFIVVLEGNLEWKMIVDGDKTQLGLLLNIALPNAIESIKKSIKK